MATKSPRNPQPITSVPSSTVLDNSNDISSNSNSNNVGNNIGGSNDYSQHHRDDSHTAATKQQLQQQQQQKGIFQLLYRSKKDDELDFAELNRSSFRPRGIFGNRSNQNTESDAPTKTDSTMSTLPGRQLQQQQESREYIQRPAPLSYHVPPSHVPTNTSGRGQHQLPPRHAGAAAAPMTDWNVDYNRNKGTGGRVPSNNYHDWHDQQSVGQVSIGNVSQRTTATGTSGAQRRSMTSNPQRHTARNDGGAQQYQHQHSMQKRSSSSSVSAASVVRAQQQRPPSQLQSRLQPHQPPLGMDPYTQQQQYLQQQPTFDVYTQQQQYVQQQPTYDAYTQQQQYVQQQPTFDAYTHQQQYVQQQPSFDAYTQQQQYVQQQPTFDAYTQQQQQYVQQPPTFDPYTHQQRSPLGMDQYTHQQQYAQPQPTMGLEAYIQQHQSPVGFDTYTQQQYTHQQLTLASDPYVQQSYPQHQYPQYQQEEQHTHSPNRDWYADNDVYSPRQYGHQQTQQGYPNGNHHQDGYGYGPQQQNGQQLQQQAPPSPQEAPTPQEAPSPQEAPTLQEASPLQDPLQRPQSRSRASGSASITASERKEAIGKLEAELAKVKAEWEASRRNQAKVSAPNAPVAAAAGQDQQPSQPRHSDTGESVSVAFPLTGNGPSQQKPTLAAPPGSFSVVSVPNSDRSKSQSRGTQGVPSGSASVASVPMGYSERPQSQSIDTNGVPSGSALVASVPMGYIEQPQSPSRVNQGAPSGSASVASVPMGYSERPQSQSRGAPSGSASVVSQGFRGRSRSQSRGSQSASTLWASFTSQGFRGRSRSQSKGTQDAPVARVRTQRDRRSAPPALSGSESVTSAKSGWQQRPTRAQSQPRHNRARSSSQSSISARFMSTLRLAMKQDTSPLISAMEQDDEESQCFSMKEDNKKSSLRLHSPSLTNQATNQVTNQVTGHSVQSHTTTQTVRSHATTKSPRHLSDQSSACSRQSQGTPHVYGNDHVSRATFTGERSNSPQEFQQTPETGSNVVILKKKGILKHAEPAPIQPIVKSILRQQQQRRGSESSVQTSTTQHTSSGHSRSIVKQQQRRGSESSTYTSNTQSTSNVQRHPSVSRRGSSGGSSTADMPKQRQDEYELALARSRSTHSEESRVDQDWIGSQYNDRWASSSDGGNGQPTTQSQALRCASNGQNLDLYAGPYTRTRQRAISMGGANDGYADTSIGSAGSLPVANFAYSERTDENSSQKGQSQLPVPFRSDSRSVISALSALTKSAYATSGTNHVASNSPGSANGKRYSGGDDGAKSVVSSTSAQTKSIYGTYSTTGSSSRKVQIVDSNDVKSVVSFATHETSQSRKSAVDKNPSLDDTTSAGVSNHSKRAVHGFAKKLTLNDEDDARSVMSSGSALTSRSYMSHASSASRKFRSASAPRPGRVDDDDTRSVVSSGSALTSRSYVSQASTGSRRSRSATKSRFDDEDTRSVVTSSSARSLSRLLYGGDDDDSKSVMTSMTSQTRGSVSSNRSEHRPAPNSWDLDRKPSSRRPSIADDDKESAQMVGELRDKVMSSLLTQQGVGEVTSRDAISLQAETNMDINYQGDYLVASSSSGQVSTDLKKYALRIQMGSLRHHLDDYQRSKLMAVLIPPTPPLSEMDDKRGYVNPFDQTPETPNSTGSLEDTLDEQVNARMDVLTGRKEPLQWTPTDSEADSLSEPGGWSPPNSNPRAKMQKRAVAEQKPKVLPMEVSSDETERKETKEMKSAKKVKKKKSKESKSKDENSRKKKPDGVAKIANDLKPVARCIQMEQELMPCDSDFDDRSPEWTGLSNPLLQPLNGQGRGEVDGEENPETKKKPIWMMDLHPDTLEQKMKSGRRAKATDDDDDAANQPQSKPAKSTKKAKKI